MFLDKECERALVAKYKNIEYKGIVSDNDISSVIQAWATSIKPLQFIIDEHWKLYCKINNKICL
jgi:hypothetical protein